MFRKRLLVFGLVLALLFSGSSVSAFAENKAVGANEAGVVFDLIGDYDFVIPANYTITGDMLVDHFKVVDFAGNDLDMGNKIFFVNQDGHLLEPDDLAATLYAAFQEDVFSRHEITATLSDNRDLTCQAEVSLGTVVMKPLIVLQGGEYRFPEGHEVTADDLMSKLSVIDVDGKKMPELIDTIRFTNGRALDGLTAVEEAVYINEMVDSYGYANLRDNGIVIGVYLKGVGDIMTLKVYFDELIASDHIIYSTHVQNKGWQEPVSDGLVAGTEGKSLRLEGIKIASPIEGVDLNYSTHIQNRGWQEPVKNGAISGSEGKSLRLEAIEIYLTGEQANRYDVYYRVHSQNIGWMAWANNGEEAGTAGYGYRLEGIQIELVEKGSKEFIDGDIKVPFMENEAIHSLTYHDLSFDLEADQQKVANGQFAIPFSGPEWEFGEFIGWTSNEATLEPFDFLRPIHQSWVLLPVYKTAIGEIVCPPLVEATHTITYNYIAADVPVTEEEEVANGSSAVAYEGHEWNGKEFSFWTTDLKTLEEFDFSKPIYQELSLYPVYEEEDGTLISPFPYKLIM